MSKQKYTITAEEKKRRSERAKALHAQGKLGGKQEGSGRKPKRAQEAVVTAIGERSDKIIKALDDSLKSKSPTVKLKAALALLEIEQRETELKIKEEQRAYENYSKEKLLEMISINIKRLKENGVDVDDVIEGTATEITQKHLQKSDG